jgi:hypothetical protein
MEIQGGTDENGKTLKVKSRLESRINPSGRMQASVRILPVLKKVF